MKKLLLSILFAAVSLAGSAQHPPAAPQEMPVRNQQYIYCKIVGYAARINKVEVRIDFGQEVDRRADRFFLDENGERVKFNSMIDALNRLAEDGWEFVQAYVVIDDGDSTVHWVLKREVTGLSDEEKAGLLSKFKTIQD